MVRNITQEEFEEECKLREPADMED